MSRPSQQQLGFLLVSDVSRLRLVMSDVSNLIVRARCRKCVGGVVVGIGRHRFLFKRYFYFGLVLATLISNVGQSRQLHIEVWHSKTRSQRCWDGRLMAPNQSTNWRSRSSKVSDGKHFALKRLQVDFKSTSSRRIGIKTT